MAQISFSDLSNGTTPDASDFNSRYNALKNRLNNGVESDNIADSAVTEAKINNGAVTVNKIGTGAVTGVKIAMGSDAQGDVLYHDGTNYVRLGAGTSGQVLQTGGASANPSWLTLEQVKAWIYFDGTAATISIGDSYNIDSITDNGKGDYTVTFDTDFSDTNYACIVTGDIPSSNDPCPSVLGVGGKATGSIRFETRKTSDNSVQDSFVNLIAFGGQ